MKIIELHILQSFPVSCLNRDDMGSPKTAVFGGVKRARISSQCLKRAQRTLFRELLPEYAQGERTKLLATAFMRLIAQRGDEVKTGRDDLHLILAEAWGKQDGKKKGGDGLPKATTLTYLSPAEMNAMIDAAVKCCTENPKTKNDDIKKAALKAVKGALSKDAADIALYGRMVANDASLTMEGAAMFSHAISTHKSEPELDFYSAVDDLQPDDESGAGMTGMLEFSSACYYRYIAVNVDLLKSHLKDVSDVQLQEILAAFIRSSLLAVPSARKNSMNACTVPSYVKGIVREGHPIQLVNAFEQPVWSAEGITAPSIRALQSEFAKMKDIWGLSVDAEIHLPENDLSTFVDTLACAIL